MEVTLKKAAALALALAGASPVIVHSVKVNPFGDPPSPEDLAALQLSFAESLTKSVSVTGAVFKIRKIIGEANVGEINELIGKRAYIDKVLGLLNAIPVRKESSSLVSLERQMEASRGESRPYGGGSSLSIELETESLLLPQIKAIKKERVAVEDALAKLNYSTTVKLPDEVVKLLTEFDLI